MKKLGLVLVLIAVLMFSAKTILPAGDFCQIGCWTVECDQSFMCWKDNSDSRCSEDMIVEFSAESIDNDGDCWVCVAQVYCKGRSDKIICGQCKPWKQ